MTAGQTSACERCQVELSTLWDEGASGREAVRSALRHVADCPECREFLREIEGLGAFAESASESPRPAVPVPVTTRMPQRGIPGARVLRAAAIVLAVLGGAWFAASSWTAPAASPESIRIELAGNRSAMDDRRFVELTTELLEADHRYRRTMLQVLRQIESEGPGLEASLDELVELPEGEAREGRPRV